MSFERLQKKILELKNPTVVGLDARLEYIPPKIVKECFETYGENLEGAAEAVYRYNVELLDALQGVVPAVKPQAAYYELLGWQGVRAMEKTIRYAREKGFYVIADIKRGDIGSTAQAYAEGWLGTAQVGGVSLPAFDADCVTINGYMGSDAILPFVSEAKKADKGVFVLVKTSNPSSGELQNVEAEGGKVYELMADLARKLDQHSEGWGTLGAVVGATYPQELSQLRLRMENTFFLVPGYGAQGGGAKDVEGAFDTRGQGAIVNSSRGIICAWKKAENGQVDHQSAARAAAEAMREDICQYIALK